MVRAVLAIIFSIFLMVPSHAQWLTKVEDDVLTDGSSATMVGLVSSIQAIHFSCTSVGAITLAYIEKGEHVSGMEIIPVKMVLRVDKQEKHWVDVQAYPHNAEYFGFRTDESARSKVVAILRDIHRGKSKIGLGLKADIGDFSWSGNTGLRGSTNAVNQLAKACKLSLD